MFLWDLSQGTKGTKKRATSNVLERIRYLLVEAEFVTFVNSVTEKLRRLASQLTETFAENVRRLDAVVQILKREKYFEFKDKFGLDLNCSIYTKDDGKP
jgi:maltooligosyltrehalose synthase